jgi:hypothetical protein
MSEYILTIRIPIKAIDDPDARVHAQSILNDFKTAGVLGLFHPAIGGGIVEDTGGVSEKLQRLEQGKPPVKVSL